MNHATFQIVVSLLLVGLSQSLPIAQNPFLNVKITQSHGGGLQTGFGTTISKQKFVVIKSNLEGETVEEEPFVDHQPPFLALPAVKPYEPLVLPKRI